MEKLDFPPLVKRNKSNISTYVDTILLEDRLTEPQTERYRLQAEDSENSTAWLIPENKMPQNQGEGKLNLRLRSKTWEPLLLPDQNGKLK